MKNDIIIRLRFQLAAIRQLLRDRGKEMTQEQQNALLDQMNALITLIEALEKEE